MTTSTLAAGRPTETWTPRQTWVIPSRARRAHLPELVFGPDESRGALRRYRQDMACGETFRSTTGGLRPAREDAPRCAACEALYGVPSDLDD